MLPLIDIVIILSGLSAAQASPLRRYANTTSHASDAITGVAYQPFAGSPSLSLAPIQGITTLPFSQLVESPADASSTSSRSSQVVASSTASNTIAEYSTSQSIRTESQPTSFSTFGGQHADTTVTITTMSYTTVQAPPPAADSHPSQVVRSSKAQIDGIPTDFSTFGGKPADVIVTRTTTTYTTLSADPQIEESQSSRSMYSSATKDTAITSATDTSTAESSAKDPSLTFVYDPLTTSTILSLLETTLSTTTTEASTAQTSPSSIAQQPHATSRSGGPDPYPSSIPTTTSNAQSSQQSNNLESSSSPETSAALPDVVNGNSDSMQATVDALTSDTTALPGITIVPQNPSVIYITVTDAGATTTVTDSGATKTETDRVAAATVTADWARGDPFEQRRRHLGER